jgi:hypothetical protein
MLMSELIARARDVPAKTLTLPCESGVDQLLVARTINALAIVVGLASSIEKSYRCSLEQLRGREP